ncbi:unnamed protein product [Cuscuta europaea]|uniref:Uncharacterized protein n=1 Tax=Cuscuta europaea TaxID=41803 RepID=A0A9P0Z839_CUSEU|nr:unnamed protein product [Cuscuta europaea]
MYNKRLKTKWMRKTSLKEDIDPLVMDEILSYDEWVIDEDETNPDDVAREDDCDGEASVARSSSQELVRGGGKGREKGRLRGNSQGQKRKRLDKGKGKMHLIDEDEELYGDDTDFDFDLDKDEDEGNVGGYDPYFRPLDSDDSIFQSSI